MTTATFVSNDVITLVNAFSLNMLTNPNGATVRIDAIDPGTVAGLNLLSCVGHQDTANVLSDILGVPVPMNRATAKVNPGDKMVVAQLHGTRLPEGATSLPDGASIQFWLVSID